MDKKNRIGHEIKTLSNLIKRKIDNSKPFADLDKITGMHGWIIGYLYWNREKGDIFQRDIEKEFKIRRSTATGMLQLMEKNGLITREPVAFDARLKKIVLTQKALAFHNAILQEIEKIDSKLVQGLTEEEINTFLNVAEKIKKNIE